MSIFKIRAFTIAPERHGEFARRYRTPAEDEPQVPGFEGADVLVPDDGRDVCLLLTRWRSHEDFVAWTQSSDFATRHARHNAGGPIESSSEVWSYARIE